MRHLIVTLDFPPLQDGGIARSMDETARGLVAAGEEVRVITRGRGATVRSHDRIYPASVTRLIGHHWKKFHALYHRAYLPWIGRGERNAVVHSSTWETAPQVLAQAAQFGWKVIVHAQGREVARMVASPADRERLRRVMVAADAVLPISAHVQDLVLSLGVPRQKVHLIHPAIDADRVRGGKAESFRRKLGLANRPVLLTLARLIERKGQDNVIRALPAVVKEVPDLAYVLVGEGSDQERLRSLANDLGLQDHVLFAGFLSEAELPDAYAAADVYVMLSREGARSGDIEGFGITYLEANAAGVPVVAGRSAGTVDAVEEGRGGVLVDPESPTELAKVLAALFRSLPEARALGERGRRRVEEEFSLIGRARRILEVAAELA